MQNAIILDIYFLNLQNSIIFLLSLGGHFKVIRLGECGNLHRETFPRSQLAGRLHVSSWTWKCFPLGGVTTEGQLGGHD